MESSTRFRDPVDIEIGRRLRSRRVELGLSQGDLGQHSGVSYQQIQKYETGHNRLSASGLVRLAQALDVHPVYLLPESGATIRGDSLMSVEALRIAVIFDGISDRKTKAAIARLIRSLSTVDG